VEGVAVGSTPGGARSRTGRPKRRWAAGFVGVLLLIAAAWVAGEVRDAIAVRKNASTARRLVAEGKFTEARDPLDRWLKARPDSGEAMFLLAKGALHFQLFDQGFGLLARAEALGYPYAPIALERATTLMRMQRLDEAASILNRLVFSPGAKADPEADKALAKCYLETFQLSAAAVVIERWIRDAPRDPTPHLWKAQVDRRTDADLTTLTEDYEKAIRLDPGCGEALLSLGEMSLLASRPREAESRYTAYLSRFPDNPEARLGLGRALSELGEETAAIRHLDRAAELAPRDTRPLLERARIDQRSGNLDRALAVLDRAIGIDAEELELHYLRSLALRRLGRKKEALAEVELSGRLRRDQEELSEILGALNASPRDVQLQYNAARWLFEHGHPEEGLRWAEKILRAQPSHPGTNRLVADHYERRGDPGLARFYRLQAGLE
jgi:tetratricopeptide (TPR) repeat protein